MKILSLALTAGLALAGYAHGQTADQSPATPPASSPPVSSSSGGAQSPSHACKKEAEKLCGRRARGQEMQDCVKSNLDLKKFSASCQTEFAQSKKPNS
jgi:hypothetical protein